MKPITMKFYSFKTEVKIPKILILLLGGVCLVGFQAKAQNSTSKKYDQVWEGTLENRIPVLLYYQEAHHLTVGKVVYLNTHAKQPIPVISHFQSEGGSFILNEYDKTGNITGVWTLTQKGDSLVGIWDKPFSTQKYGVHLTKKDTLIPAEPMTADPSEIAGEYYYQYGEKGPQGEWKIQRIGRDSIAVDAYGVTSAPARNIADVTDTVALKENHFSYTVSDNWSGKKCKIVIKGQFYKNFLWVTYINEHPCRSYFGHNATLEGVYYKIRHKRN